MTCRDATDFLMDYLSGELPVVTRGIFEWHLLICTDCRAYLATYRAAVEAGKAAFETPDAEAAGEVPEDLIKAILASLPSRGGS